MLAAALQAGVIYTNFGDGDSFLAGSGLPPELQETPLVIHEPGGFCLMGFGLASLLLVHRQKFARFPNQK